jgi:hypothetical protein
MTVTESIREKAPEVPAPSSRPVRCCGTCGERAGSISAGTGRPLVLDKDSGHWFHLSCRPGAVSFGASLASFASLEGLGA